MQGGLLGVLSSVGANCVSGLYTSMHLFPMAAMS